MSVVLIWINFAVGLILLVGLAVIFRSVRRGRREMTVLGEEVRKLRTVESVNLFRQIQSLMGLRELLHLTAPLPPLRGWAAAPDLLLVIARHALNTRPAVIVECSSGASTVVLAQAARQNGTGHVYSLEHDPHYAGMTRSLLADHGLQDLATVIDAPLEPVTIQGQTYNWYSDAGLAGIGPIDMVVMDGPPFYVNRLARYPAGPKLFPRLAAGAAVFMDDATREGEKKAVERWLAEFPHLSCRTIDCEAGCVSLAAPASMPGTSERQAENRFATAS